MFTETPPTAIALSNASFTGSAAALHAPPIDCVLATTTIAPSDLYNGANTQGITLLTGDLVLVYNLGAFGGDGIWQVGAGAGARPASLDTSTEIDARPLAHVRFGTDAGKIFIANTTACTPPDPSGVTYAATGLTSSAVNFMQDILTPPTPIALSSSSYDTTAPVARALSIPGFVQDDDGDVVRDDETAQKQVTDDR